MTKTKTKTQARKERGPDALWRRKGDNEDGRQGKAWEGHALKSHCSTTEHKAKAQSKSRPTRGGQHSPPGLHMHTFFWLCLVFFFLFGPFFFTVVFPHSIFLYTTRQPT